MNDYFVEDIYSQASFEILAERNDSRVTTAAALYSVIAFSCIFLVGSWLYVSAKINYFLKRKGLKIKPGWSVGWYCVPFACIIMPYRSLKETFKASFDRDDWQNQKTTGDFPLWWVTFLISGASSRVAWRMMERFESSPAPKYTDLNAISYVEIASDITYIISAFFLLRIIKVVSENHEKQT